MDIEYEATFTNINKDDIRAKLKSAGAKLIKSEFLQKRVTFNLPSGHEIEGGFIRVRDEDDQITMSLKAVNSGKIEDQKEIQIKVDNFAKAEQMLKTIGCEWKAYQETKRELWELGDVEIAIDEWPHLEPFVEIEGESESVIKKVSEQLGFDYSKAKFCSVDTQYSEKYGVSEHFVNNEVSKIVFEGENPFN